MSKLDRHIQIYDDYMDDISVDYILKQFKNKKNHISKDPYNIERSTLPLKPNDIFYFWLDSIIDPILDKYKEQSYSDFEYKFRGEPAQILKYVKGDERFLHAGDPHKRERISISCLMFLTDGHMGGTVYFPDQDITIAPKKGRIVLFPSCFLYPHEVTRLCSSQPRYTLTRGYQFINLKNNYRDPNYVYKSTKQIYSGFDDKYRYAQRKKDDS